MAEKQLVKGAAKSAAEAAKQAATEQAKAEQKTKKAALKAAAVDKAVVVGQATAEQHFTLHNVSFRTLVVIGVAAIACAILAPLSAFGLERTTSNIVVPFADRGSRHIADTS